VSSSRLVHEYSESAPLIVGLPPRWTDQSSSRSEPQNAAPKHAQFVFSETVLGFADGKNDASFQIVAPPTWSSTFNDGIEQQSIDCEIAAQRLSGSLVKRTSSDGGRQSSQRRAESGGLNQRNLFASATADSPDAV
jgi:hypothetical protein